MDLVLASDYTEAYDFEFKKTGTRFDRYKKSHLTREECFFLLTNCGFKTPHHGLVEDLVPFLFEFYSTENLKLIVYLNNYYHTRSSIVVLDAKKAFNLYKDKYSSEFIKCDEEKATTYTYLKIGRLDFGIVYTANDNSLFSNELNNSTIKVACSGEGTGYHPKIKFPIFSIDYINNNNQLYAIDFNISPSITETKIQVFLSPQEIYKEIARASERVLNKGA